MSLTPISQVFHAVAPQNMATAPTALAANLMAVGLVPSAGDGFTPAQFGEAITKELSGTNKWGFLRFHRAIVASAVPSAAVSNPPFDLARSRLASNIEIQFMLALSPCDLAKDERVVEQGALEGYVQSIVQFLQTSEDVKYARPDTWTGPAAELRFLAEFTIGVGCKNFKGIKFTDIPAGILRDKLIENPSLLRGVDLSGADLRDVDLICADLSGSDLRGVDLTGADLSRANLRGAKMDGANLSGADLSGASLIYAEIGNAKLIGAILKKADLEHAFLGNSDLTKADLTEAKVHFAKLGSANLTGANLSGADFYQAWLTQALLTGADLRDAKMGGAQIDKILYGAKVAGADLTGADLTGANLHGAGLAGAILKGAKLTGANLNRAKLPGFWPNLRQYFQILFSRKSWDD